MKSYEVLIKGYKCNRCGNEWAPKNWDKIPGTCPKCKSPYWNKKRIREVN